MPFDFKYAEVSSDSGFIDFSGAAPHILYPFWIQNKVVDFLLNIKKIGIYYLLKPMNTDL